MHCIGLLKILENVILTQERDNAKSYNHHDPETVDDSLLVCLKQFYKEKFSIADFDLHKDEKSYNKRDECKNHHSEQCKYRQYNHVDSFRTDRYFA